MGRRGRPYPFHRQQDWWYDFDTFGYGGPLQWKTANGMGTGGTLGGGWGNGIITPFPTYDIPNACVLYDLPTPATASPRTGIKMRVRLGDDIGVPRVFQEVAVSIDGIWSTWFSRRIGNLDWFGGLGIWRCVIPGAFLILTSPSRSFGISGGDFVSLKWSETTAWPPNPW